MSIFYTIGNTNMKTIELVSMAMLKKIKDIEIDEINKVIILNTPSSHKCLLEQIDIYRKFLGDVIVEEVILDENGMRNPQEYASIFEYSGNKLVDLTNGQKSTSSVLYMQASLVGIDNIYYISLRCSPKDLPDEPEEGIHYEYIKIDRLNSISYLSKISYFDLIYYTDELKLILGDSNSSFIKKIEYDITTSINDFFDNASFRSAISNATTFVEVAIETIFSFLKEYEYACNFANENGVKFEGNKDSLGVISYFFKVYNNKAVYEEEMKDLISVSGLLGILRSFRNLAAHSGNSPYTFKSEDVRVVITTAIETLRCMKTSKILWEKFEQNK